MPAEDVRSRVIALRALALCLRDAGDAPAAVAAARQAHALAFATEQSSERLRTEEVLREVTGRGGTTLT